ncbi:MAG: ParB N-terminal domain-containing protein [Planctomycetes bacterium]|nr:ParB N-terminal domain-containing protein [Planctomycetota bacterium]
MSPPRHQLMPVTDLRPAEYNPRRISEESMAGLSVSIERFGLVQPINWNQRTNRVVGGHRRLKALAARGVEQTEVIVVDLPESEEKALNVALNSPAIAGEFVPEDLDVLLTEIRQSVPELFDALLLEELASNALREAFGLNGGQRTRTPSPSPGTPR